VVVAAAETSGSMGNISDYWAPNERHRYHHPAIQGRIHDTTTHPTNHHLIYLKEIELQRHGLFKFREKPCVLIVLPA